MTLTLEQIKAITQGAVSVCENNKGYFSFARFTEQGRAYYEKTNPDFEKKTHATSGIRFDFLTDSENFHFDFLAKAASSRRYFYFDVCVDGVLCAHIGEPEGLPEAIGNVNLDLPAGKHRVTVYFPWTASVTLSGVTLSDGACIEPTKKLHRLLCFGDSITQGYDALFPSQTYPNQLADLLCAEVVDLGIGGERFCPDLLDAQSGYDPDIITVAYGTNDWNRRKHDHMVAEANEFYRRLREIYPKAKIFAITPIWRADKDRITEVGSFDQAVDIVRSAAELQEGIVAVDGMRLVPHLPDMYADKYLHPNDLGFQFYAAELGRIIKESL